MWVKVDDRFPDSWRVFAAADHLRPCSTGRVIAVWLEMACRCVRADTDLFALADVLTLTHDRRPLDVVEAMARACALPGGDLQLGLLEKVGLDYRMVGLCSLGSRDGPSRRSMQPRLQEVIERLGASCVYCDAIDVPLQVDHIIPVVRGGGDEIENLAPACERCNKRKGSKTASEFGYPFVEAIGKALASPHQ
jgi:hypothetical protein